jgi:hypothetical protein
MDKICRTCMCSSSMLLSIFENSLDAEDTIFEMLKSIDLHVSTFSDYYLKYLLKGALQQRQQINILINLL